MSALDEPEELADHGTDQEDEERDHEENDEELEALPHERIRAMRAFALLTIQTPTRALGG